MSLILVQPAPGTGQQRLTQAIDEFRQQLTPADRATLSQTLQPDVVAVTELTSQFDKNSNLKRKQLGDKLQPFLQFIQSLGDIVNIYIQIEPKIAALVWGSVKLVVQASRGPMAISANYFDYFVRISDLFVKITHLCPTIERIGQLFQNSIKLHDAVLEFYAIIVEFCSKAFVFLHQPGLKQFVKSIWKPFKVQFQGVEEELADQRERINDEVLIASEIATHQAAQQALVYQRRGYAHRIFEVDQWAKQTNWQLQQHALIKKTEFVQILQQICPYGHTRSFNNTRDRRHLQTGQWMVALPVFTDWYKSTTSSTLWYHGIPGSGKSMLATSLIDHIVKENRFSKASVIYFFCDFQNAESLSYRVMISSLLMQLAALNQPLEVTILSKLEEVYDSKLIPPRVKEIEELVKKFVRSLDEVYIIMDGIDECSTGDKLELLLFLKGLLKAKPDYLKIILSSRSDIDTPRVLNISHQFPITAATHRPDLESYINDELEDKCPNLALYPTKLKDEVKSALLKGADGMFLWVHFQIQDIRNASSSKKIKELLQGLPRGLHNTYARIVRRIITEKDSSEAFMVFKWLSASLRPLKLTELRDAISIRVEDTQYRQIRERHSDDLQSTISNCCHLVTFNHGDQTVEYAHSTVAKYLEANLEALFEVEIGRTISRSIFESRISVLCATYLKLGDYQTQNATSRKKQSVSQGPFAWLTKILFPFLDPIVLAFLQSVFNYQTNAANPHSGTQEDSIESILDSLLSPGKPWDEFASTFPFLDYINTHWLDHFRFEHLAEKKVRLGCLEALRELVFDCSLPFRYLPLVNGNEKPDAGSLIIWACKQDHLPLFLVIEAEPRCSSSYTPYELPSLWNISPYNLVDTPNLWDISPSELVDTSIKYGSSNVCKYMARNWLSKESGVWLERKKGSYTETTRTGQQAKSIRLIKDLLLDPRSGNPIPLAIAAGLGHVSIIRALLPVYLSNLSVKYEDITSISWFQISVKEALENDQLEVIKLFLEADGIRNGHGRFDPTTDVTWQDFPSLPTFWTEISLAAIEKQKMNIMRFFLQLGAYDFKPTSCVDREEDLPYENESDQILNHFVASFNAIGFSIETHNTPALSLLLSRFQDAPFMVTAVYEAIVSGSVSALDLFENFGIFCIKNIDYHPGTNAGVTLSCPCGLLTVEPAMEAVKFERLDTMKWLWENKWLSGTALSDALRLSMKRPKSKIQAEMTEFLEAISKRSQENSVLIHS